MRVIAVALAVVLCAGCGATRRGLYDWGDYEDGTSAQLLDHDPAAAQAIYERTLSELQQRNGRVPPGLFADYGFLLYLRGDYPGALRGFETEKRLFPESAPLMDRLCARVRERQGLAASGDGVPAPTPPFSSSDSRPPMQDSAP